MPINYLSTEIISINNPKIVKMLNDYFYEGYALLVLVLCELCKQEDFKYSLNDMDVLTDNIKANSFLQDNAYIKSFINDCIYKYESKGEYIFQTDGKMFWSDSLIKSVEKRKTKRANGEKGGRPARPGVTDRLEIPDIEYVNLEKADYSKLIEKFGKETIDKGIQLLDNWLAIKGQNAKKYLGRNHYALFRKDSWVINNAKKALEENVKSLWGNL